MGHFVFSKKIPFSALHWEMGKVWEKYKI